MEGKEIVEQELSTDELVDIALGILMLICNSRCE